MLLKIFAMRDEKSELFIRPFFMPNLALAQRAIVSAGQEAEHPFSRHPRDYILYELGTWDEEHAEFDVRVAPIRHGSVGELTPKSEEIKDGKSPVSHEAPVFDRSASGNSS